MIPHFSIVVLVLIGGCSSPAAPLPPVPSPQTCVELGIRWLNDSNYVPPDVLATRADVMAGCGLQELDPATHNNKITQEQIKTFLLFKRAWLILLDRLEKQRTPAPRLPHFEYASIGMES